MRIDLALNPFEADLGAMLRVAVAAEAAGIDGLWVADHFSGSVVDTRWSREPFVCLGALAATTERVRVGPLVANVRNRHPAQLASAANSLQSLAPGRVVLGMGAGAAPGSRFAVEHDAIGTDLGPSTDRRRRLVEHIEHVRALHRAGIERIGAGRMPSGSTGGPAGESAADMRLAVTDGEPCPPIVVGASARSTVEVAVEHADGVNLRSGSEVPRLVDLVRSAAPAAFEVSVLEGSDVDRRMVQRYEDLGVDRLVIGVDVRTESDAHRAVLDRLDALRSRS